MITDECVEWDRSTTRGYGVRRLGQTAYYAHRLAYAEVHGPIPDGMCVLHKCDNPPCFNVDHLFLGTKKDNTRDMLAKGRNKYITHHGESHGNAKLTDATVTDIRTRFASGEDPGEIAADVGIHKCTVVRVAKRQTWRHL